MKTFFRTLARTLYDPTWYQEVFRQRTQAAINFYLKLAVVLLAIVVVSSWGFLLTLVNFERNTPQYLNDLVAKYPADLKVTIHDGHATTNVKEPYFIALPKDKTANNGDITNLVVIDTHTDFSADQFAKYHAAAWLRSDSLVYLGNYSRSNDASVVNEIKVVPLKDVPNVDIDRSFIHDKLEQFLPWARVLAPIGAVFLAGFIYVVMLLHLVYFLLLALLVWLVAWVLRRPLSDYGTSYRVALYAATVPLIVSGVANGVGHSLPQFTVTALALLIVVVNMSRLPRQLKLTESVPTDSTSTPQ